MNSYQLGKVGITLLALYMGLAVVLSIIQSMGQALGFGIRDMEVSELGLVAPYLCCGLLLGILPAAVLLWRRDSLARRWFADEGAGEGLTASGGGLLRIGLVLLGASAAIDGALSLVGGVAMGITASSIGGDAARSTGITSGIQIALRGTAGIVLGALLVRYSRRLSERWTQ